MGLVWAVADDAEAQKQMGQMAAAKARLQQQIQELQQQYAVRTCRERGGAWSQNPPDSPLHISQALEQKAASLRPPESEAAS